MKREVLHYLVFTIICIILVLIGTFFARGEAPQEGWTTKGKVVRVVDGDTVDVSITYIIRIRLLDCWAPEVRTRDIVEKRNGLRSAKYLTEMIGDEEALIFIPMGEYIGKSFSFDRLLGRMWLDEVDISEHLVEHGYATKEKE